MSLVLKGILSRFSTMADGGGRLQFDTQELTPNEFKEVGESVKKAGLVVFYPDREEDLTEEEREALEEASKDAGLRTSKRSKSSKSQVLRAVFYKYWEQDDQGFKDPEAFYNHYMDQIINHFKKILDGEE